MGFDLDFSTCFEVDQDLIETALAPAHSLADPAPRDKIFALIERMARVARPRQGAARMLTVFARLAECDWLEGELEILLCDLGEATGINVMLHDGLSFVRLHAPIQVGVPFIEFATAFERDPLAVSPLEEAPADPDVLRLRASEATSSHGGRHAAALPASGDEEAVADAEPAAPDADTVELLSKPTVRLRAVRIPREAYRDDHRPQSKPGAPAGARERKRDPNTTQTKAVQGEAELDEGTPISEEMPETKRVRDDIDDDWE